MASAMVESTGVRLHARSRGTSGPIVILLHGFPDNQRVWNSVADDLAQDFRVVTYDARGAGSSSTPASKGDYAMGHLVDDLIAVIEHAAPGGEAVHLVGHDWGSVQMWGAVFRSDSDPRLDGRIASFTSISGPGLSIFGRFIRDAFRDREFLTIAKQGLKSWYIVAFQVPIVPELVLRRFGRRIQSFIEKIERGAHFGPEFITDAVHGINLYRANWLDFSAQSTNLPVHLVIPVKDAYLNPELYANLETHVPHLKRTEVDAGHWSIAARPERTAQLIREFVRDVENQSHSHTA